MAKNQLNSDALLITLTFSDNNSENLKLKKPKKLKFIFRLDFTVRTLRVTKV